jgi:hypothetical protein
VWSGGTGNIRGRQVGRQPWGGTQLHSAGKQGFARGQDGLAEPYTSPTRGSLTSSSCSVASPARPASCTTARCQTFLLGAQVRAEGVLSSRQGHATACLVEHTRPGANATPRCVGNRRLRSRTRGVCFGVLKSGSDCDSADKPSFCRSLACARPIETVKPPAGASVARTRPGGEAAKLKWQKRSSQYGCRWR